MTKIVEPDVRKTSEFAHCSAQFAVRRPLAGSMRRTRADWSREMRNEAALPVFEIARPVAVLPLAMQTRPAPLADKARAGRLLFYSHDTFGLGHIRRTQAICEAVTEALEGAAALILTGSSAVQSLKLPAGVDYVKLPSVTKVGDETYTAKFLPVEFEAVKRMREQLILSSIISFQPDVVFVDNVPLGMKKELVPALEHIRTIPNRPRMILTLRDILDEPARIVKQWTEDRVYEAIDRYYDEVVIYGLPEVFDFVEQYQLPASLARKVSYAGYIDRHADTAKTAEMRERLAPNGEKLVLCTVGGGGDGKELVEAFLAGIETRRATEPTRAVAVFGPDMPEASRISMRQRYAHRDDLVLMEFCSEMTACIAAADVVVSMGGYNTVCEILALQKKAVLVPRVQPRLEQWIRCSRLDEMGLVRNLHPAAATPQVLWQAIDASLAGDAGLQREAVRFDGLNFVVDVIRKIFAEPAVMPAAALPEQFCLQDWAPSAMAS